MEENELKCKLEEMAAGMGYEVRKKFKKELDPIYKIIQTLVVFGFLTVVMLLGTFYFSTSNNKSPCCNQEKQIIYKEKIVKVRTNVEDLFTDKDLFKMKTMKGSKYFYYKKHYKNKTFYFTKAIKIKK